MIPNKQAQAQTVSSKEKRTVSEVKRNAGYKNHCEYGSICGLFNPVRNSESWPYLQKSESYKMEQTDEENFRTRRQIEFIQPLSLSYYYEL